MKVLKNFACNGVKKKVGQILTEEEAEKIGQKFGEQLVKDDFIQLSEEDQDSDEDENLDSDSDQDQDLDSDSDEDYDKDEDSDEDEKDCSDDDLENEKKIDLEKLNKDALLAYAVELEIEVPANAVKAEIKELIKAKLEA